MTSRCVACGAPRTVHDDFTCGTFVAAEDLCPWCEGTGQVVTDDDFTDGMRCRDCAGQGWVRA